MHDGRLFENFNKYINIVTFCYINTKKKVSLDFETPSFFHIIDIN